MPTMLEAFPAHELEFRGLGVGFARLISALDLFTNLFNFRRDALRMRWRSRAEDCILSYLRSGDCFVISRSPVRSRRVAPSNQYSHAASNHRVLTKRVKTGTRAGRCGKTPVSANP